MNKAFKVLWNQVRNTYVVASEAQTTHGKPGKATKTIVAAAVAGLMAVGSSASALTLNESNVLESGTTKFHSGNGELIIETEGDARNLISAIKDFVMAEEANKAEALDALRGALGTGKGITLVGSAGGENFMDSSTLDVLNIVEGFVGNPEFNQILNTLLQQLNSAQSDVTLTGDVNVSIDKAESPLLVGTVSADNVIGMNGEAVRFVGGKQEVTNVTRTGNVYVNFDRGNSIGLVGGSSAINVNGLEAQKSLISANFSSVETNVKLEGSTNINLTGKNTSLGVFGAGSAIALGGKASSQVTESSNIKVNLNTDTEHFNGVVGGVAGGGLSVGLLGGVAQSSVGDTNINLEKGIISGILGGGLALSASSSTVVDSFVSAVNEKIQETYNDTSVGVSDELKSQGGEAVTNSGTIKIQIGGKDGPSVIGIAGGGMAISESRFDSTSDSIAQSHVKDVHIQVGQQAVVGPALSDEQKSIYIGGINSLIEKITTAQNGSGLGSLLNFDFLEEGLETFNQPGVNIGIVGGGIAMAHQSNNGATELSGYTAQSTATAGDVVIDINSGYNVGVVGAGIAAGSAASTEKIQTNATSTVNSVELNFAGGETIGVMGGGISIFAGSSEPNDGIGSEVHVKEDITVNVVGGSVDGIIGGGWVIDDTNADSQNPDNNAAMTIGGKVTIDIASGNVGSLAIHSTGNKFEVPTAERPSITSYFQSAAHVIDSQKVAILGGSIASGSDAQYTEEKNEGLAHVGEIAINLRGSAVIGDSDKESYRGNIYGGGLATDGAWSSVGTSTITLDGSEVNGDIYAGGIALEGKYSTSGAYHNDSIATVEIAKIILNSGVLNGNLYAGGKVISDTTGEEQLAQSVVKNSTITLLNADVFQGTLIDGTNADEATLIFANDSFDMSSKKVTAFDTIDGSAQSVTGLAYSFGEKDTTNVLGNVAFSSVTAGGDSKTMNIGTTDRTGVASIKTLTDATTFNVANGLLALNTDSTDAAVSAFAGAGAQNAVYVTGVFNFNESIVTVGDVADATSSGIYVGTNGALIADADGGTTISTVLNMRDGSKVHFADVASASEKGSEVLIDEVNGSFATSVDNVLYTAVRNEGDKVSYTFTQRSEEDLDEVGLGDVDDTEALGDISHQNDDASEYIKGFLDQSNTSIDNTNRSQQINAAMNLAAAAGVQTVAIDSAAMGIDAAAKRASLINDFAEGGVLFAEATGKRFEMGGSSDFGAIKADLGGIVVGGEYTMNDWTFGALANLGTGTVRGQDTNSGVKNDVDYYGVQAYAAKRFGSFNVVSQVGYVTTSNDVSHATAALDKADIDADVMSVGVRGEMRFDLTQNTRLVPYVGVNYLRVSTDGFHTKQGLEVKDQDQDIVTIPVGVKFAGDMQTASGWKWTPSMDIGYVAALGDRDTDARTKVGATTVHTSMDVWSESVVRTSFGLKAQKENWGFGVQAGSALGSDDTQELFGQVRVDYRF